MGEMNRTAGTDLGRTSRSFTRRHWAALLAAAPFAGRIADAQVAATPQNPPPLAAPSAGTPEQRLAKALDEVRKVSDRLAQTEIPMAVEPAFTFHV
jgi:hypothetical protein